MFVAFRFCKKTSKMLSVTTEHSVLSFENIQGEGMAEIQRKQGDFELRR